MLLKLCCHDHTCPPKFIIGRFSWPDTWPFSNFHKWELYILQKSLQGKFILRQLCILYWYPILYVTPPVTSLALENWNPCEGTTVPGVFSRNTSPYQECLQECFTVPKRVHEDFQLLQGCRDRPVRISLPWSVSPTGRTEVRIF